MPKRNSLKQLLETSFTPDPRKVQGSKIIEHVSISRETWQGLRRFMTLKGMSNMSGAVDLLLFAQLTSEGLVVTNHLPSHSPAKGDSYASD
jgi:hypothetical protein